MKYDKAKQATTEKRETHNAQVQDAAMFYERRRQDMTVVRYRMASGRVKTKTLISRRKP